MPTRPLAPWHPLRTMVRAAERAMARASDARELRGNAARLLVDGTDAFPAWLAAINGARRWVHLENYIIRDDDTGRCFRDALAERSRAGVAVRVLYDWVGCWATPRSFWRPLREAGVEVRPFAPPRLSDPFSPLRRDHRKVVAVDGEYASVAGMCIGDEWAGVPARGIPPWRDTGVEFRGPAAAAIDRAFARSWRWSGGVLPPEEVPDPSRVAPRGEVAVRVVEGEPGKSRIYRLMQFVAVGVERRLWITDPYFVLPPAMVEALAAAARGGVDVRVLVPAYNNWPVVGGMSRAGYRPLLEAGVRLFEWEGPMIHAKTAVADGNWARVGSTNMNLASLLGNWELDVAVTDRAFAHALEELFEADLESAVEVQLRPTRVGGGFVRERRQAERLATPELRESAPDWAAAARAARRLAYRPTELGRIAGRLARAASVLGRSLVGERLIGREDRGWVIALAVLLMLAAVAGFLVPWVLAWPAAVLCCWIAVAAVVRLVAGHNQPPAE